MQNASESFLKNPDSESLHQEAIETRASFLKISEDLRNISPDLKLYTNGDTMITSNVIEFLKTLDSVNVSVGSDNKNDL